MKGKQLFAGILFFVIAIAIFLTVSSCSTIESTPKVESTAKEAFFPQPTNYVVDAGNILSQQTEDQLIEKLKAFDSKAQIAVVTVQTISPLTIEQYGIALGDKWKVGDKEKDNGIILIVAVKERKVRIEVGYGMEGTINDAKAGKILDDDVIPSFKNGDWDGGVLKGVYKIIELIK